MRPHLTRREFGLASAAVAAGALLEACGSKETPSASETVGPITGDAASSVVPWAASGKAPSTTITVYYFSGPEFDSIQELAPEFTDLTKGKIKVKMVSIPINQNLAATINQIKSNSSADLVDAGSQQAADVNPYLLPLKSMMADPGLFNADVYKMDDFPRAVQTVASDPDKGLMSLTIGSDVQMLYYRKDLLAKWGITVPAPPAAWTWQQLEAALVTVKAKIAAEKLSMSPIAVSGSQDAGGSMFALTSMWGWGGDPFKDGKPNFTDPKAVEGLSHWSGLLNTLKVASPGSPTYAYNELLAALQQGKTAMAVEWNAAASTLADRKLSPVSAGKLGYALLPYSEGLPATTPRVFPTTHTLGVSAKSKNPREAFEFAAWYTSQATARKMVAAGHGSSGRISVLTDPAIVAKMPSLDTVGESVKLYHPIPNIPSFGDLLQNVMAPPVNAMFTGQDTPEQTAKALDTGMQRLISKASK